jgi:hypothetical protein
VNRLGVLLILIALALCAAAAPVHADPPDAQAAPAPPKPNSFAPRPAGSRVYGSPIEPQILHAHKRKPVRHRSAAPASASPSHAAAALQP